MNTSDYLLQNGLDENIALVDGDDIFTYGDLKFAAARLAGELLVAGLRPGDRVGILAKFPVLGCFLPCGNEAWNGGSTSFCHDDSRGDGPGRGMGGL